MGIINLQLAIIVFLFLYWNIKYELDFSAQPKEKAEFDVMKSVCV